ncbi:MAG: hypothetical protein IJU31_00570 [Synergistaceae bacterium]|nr:hypothetical protein [Synergistaceae bacterium]
MTGNATLDVILPLLSAKKLDKLADYARCLNWTDEDDDDDDGSWADLPLTPDEEEQLRLGREEAKNGEYLTLEEFLEGL